MTTPQESDADRELAGIRQHIREAKDAAEDAHLHDDEKAPAQPPYHEGIAPAED